MISYIKGLVMHKGEHSVVVLNGQLGYEILLPATRLLQCTIGNEVEFYTYFHVREDVMQLFGFENWEERDFFMLLLNVSGVGPKGALAIIGQTTLAGLHQAISSENLQFLVKLPGVGKKTAQRLVLELKDKLPAMNAADLLNGGSATMVSNDSDDRHDIFAVLSALGYHDSEIRRIYPQIKELPHDTDEQTLIKHALKLLAPI